MSCSNVKQIIKVKRVHPLAKLPVYATAGAAAADVHCVSDTSVAINPGCSAVFDTGLQFEVPEGYELKAFSRSGHGFKSGIRLSNCTGILDSDYRGNLMVKLHNDSDTVYLVAPFERVCQIQIGRVVQHVFADADVLSDTARGAHGFGSTGTTAIHEHQAPVDGGHVHTISLK